MKNASIDELEVALKLLLLPWLRKLQKVKELDYDSSRFDG